MGGTGATGGGAGTGGSGGGGSDPKPYFSFFVTGMAALLELAPDHVEGFGGDLGGLAGADQICTTLAQRGSPGDTKTWRAFLSTTGMFGGEKVDAIDRVGPGPWYDFNGRLLAQDAAGLTVNTGQGGTGRPNGDAQLAEMFPDEYGQPIRPSQQVDNHDTLTGSTAAGRLYTNDGMNGAIATCNDWTSATVRGSSKLPVGHSWPRSESNGRQWIQDHTVNGCEPGVSIEPGPGADPNDFTVGAGGGYGGFYCFALGAIPPTPADIAKLKAQGSR